MTLTIWILRHGDRHDFIHPEWFNTAERRYDPPLADSGHRQAQQLAHQFHTDPKFKGIKHIFCSPFLRTIQTAAPIAQALNLPIKLEAGLGEWHNPDWMTHSPDTTPRSQLEQAYPCIDPHYRSSYTPTYPESAQELQTRAVQIFLTLRSTYQEPLIMVSHRPAIEAILTHHFGSLDGFDVTPATPFKILDSS
jgi:broad specificity phosphatase PhoE